jgi:SH3-like domain-containing protein
MHAAVAAEKGLPVPRFVTLRSDEVNVRVGPDIKYPIDWIFKRKNMPVEIIQEFDTWRKIRDSQGTEGWVHQSMISGRRTIVVVGEIRTLLRRPDPAAEPVARAEPGVIAKLLECPAATAWCRVDAQGARGWIRRAEIWGVYPTEIVQ